MPEEYYKIFSQLALQQAEDVKRQQIAEGMKRLLEQQGGHVEIKEVQHNEYMKQKNLQHVPQNSGHPHVLPTGKLPQLGQYQAGAHPQAAAVQYQGVSDLNEEQLYQLLNTGSDEKLVGGPVQIASAYGKQTQQAQQAQPQKYYYQTASSELSEGQRAHHQAPQYAAQHTRPRGGNRPLQDTSLEKEIAKLEGSFNDGYKQHYSQPQHQQRKHKPQFQQYHFSSEETGQYAQPQAAALTSEPHQYSQLSSKEQQKPQYASDVQRFYHQQPTPVQHQAEQNKVQYYSTERPVYEHSSYDSSSPVKIVQSPNLKYQNPQTQHHHYAQQQPQQHALYQDASPEVHKVEQPSAEISSEIYQKALGHNSQNAPSRSAIYVSQTTGAPPAHKKQYNKQSQLQQQHQHQHQQLHHHHAPQSAQQSSQEQSHETGGAYPEVRLPPINNGRPLTQEEFQALVDAGYSVTAVPVPVAVPAEEYYKNQKQQELKAQYKQQPAKRNPYSQAYKSAESEQHDDASVYHHAYRSPYSSHHTGHKLKQN